MGDPFDFKTRRIRLVVLARGGVRVSLIVGHPPPKNERTFRQSPRPMFRCLERFTSALVGAAGFR